MPLPPRSYYHLQEVANAWGLSVPELASYVMDGLLDVSVMAICKRVEIGIYEETDETWHAMPTDYKVLNGPQPVMSEDLWPVFQKGHGRVTRFKPQAGHDYATLRDDEEPIDIVLNDLLVVRSERQRFERKYALRTEPDAIEPAQPTFTHNETYSEVCIHGQRFTLGIIQAAIVRQLHERSQTAHPWVSGKELLRNSGSGSTRLNDVFKGKDDWKELIAADGRGLYRLKLDQHHSAEASERAYRRLQWSFGSDLLAPANEHYLVPRLV
jgi:hypothetical protein